jgi:hypothetical protein
LVDRVGYDLRLRIKPDVCSVTPSAAPDPAPPDPDAPARRAKTAFAGGRPCFKATDRAIADEILTEKVTSPIDREQASTLRTVCPKWAREWMKVPGNLNRMPGAGSYEAKHRRLRDALRDAITARAQK